jgi:hypothetical protein
MGYGTGYPDGTTITFKVSRSEYGIEPGDRWETDGYSWSASRDIDDEVGQRALTYLDQRIDRAKIWTDRDRALIEFKAAVPEFGALKGDRWWRGPRGWGRSIADQAAGDIVEEYHDETDPKRLSQAMDIELGEGDYPE